MLALLTEGDVEGRYESRSNRVQASATACVGAGWSYEAWHELLHSGKGDLATWSTHKRERGDRLKERTPADTERRLRACWASAEAYVAAHPAVADAASVRAEVAALRQLAALDPWQWRGQSGISDNFVLHQLYGIAERANQLTVGSACRTLALACQMTHGTAAKALRRLIARGWLRIETPTDGRHATVYRLLRPTAVLSPAHLVDLLEDLPEHHLVPHGGSVVAHDVFVPARAGRGGLGRTAARILDCLDDGAYGGITVAQIALRTGLHPRTVTRHLATARDSGLATVGLRGGWARSAALADLSRREQLLSELAGRLQTLGTLTLRRDRIAAERDAREEFHARRGWAVERGLRQPGQTELPLTQARAA